MCSINLIEYAVILSETNRYLEAVFIKRKCNYVGSVK
jgi:hypothetical protein